jgi:hypothetical protein
VHWLTLVPGCGFACGTKPHVALCFFIRDELLGLFGGPATLTNEFNGAETLYCGCVVHSVDVYVSDGHDSVDGGHAIIVRSFLRLDDLHGQLFASLFQVQLHSHDSFQGCSLVVSVLVIITNRGDHVIYLFEDCVY